MVTSTLIRRCPDNYRAIYTLALTYLAQGNTRRAIWEIKSAQVVCALPSVISKWVEETRRLNAIAPTLAGLPEFLDALEHPKRKRGRIGLYVRKRIASLMGVENVDEGPGGQWEEASLPRMGKKREDVLKALRGETVEVREQGVHLVLTCDEHVQVLEVDGEPNEHLAKALNMAITKISGNAEYQAYRNFERCDRNYK